MKRTFSGLYARTFCHATEDPERVKQALRNTIGDAEIHVVKTEGHHGNPITIMESNLREPEGILSFFEKLERDDLSLILDTLPARVDDGCNLFLKIDKQAAYEGRIRMGQNDDVISVRVKVSAFPARCQIAQAMTRALIEDIILSKDA